jgi:hypothetical protein
MDVYDINLKFIKSVNNHRSVTLNGFYGFNYIGSINTDKALQLFSNTIEKKMQSFGCENNDLRYVSIDDNSLIYYTCFDESWTYYGNYIEYRKIIDGLFIIKIDSKGRMFVITAYELDIFY